MKNIIKVKITATVSIYPENVTIGEREKERERDEKGDRNRF